MLHLLTPVAGVLLRGRAAVQVLLGPVQGEIEQFLLGLVQVAEGDLGVGSGVGAEGQLHLHGPDSGLHLGLILLLAWIR